MPKNMPKITLSEKKEVAKDLPVNKPVEVSQTDAKINALTAIVEGLANSVQGLLGSQKPVDHAQELLDEEVKKKADALRDAKKLIYEENLSKHNNLQYTDHYYDQLENAGKDSKDLPVIHVP